VIFSTERLVARDWTLDDADAAYEIYRDPDVMRFLGTAPQPVASVEAQRERIAAWLERNAGWDDCYGFWALATHDGTLVGATLLKPLPGDGPVEVGWHLGKAYWGNGYATEGARGAIAHGFGAAGLDAIYAVVDPANAASLAVARRLGMTYEGRTDLYYEKTLDLFSIRPQPTS
jgi:RimJ/RimL family protein N-acetyltransferase